MRSFEADLSFCSFTRTLNVSDVLRSRSALYCILKFPFPTHCTDRALVFFLKDVKLYMALCYLSFLFVVERTQQLKQTLIKARRKIISNL